MRRFALYGSVAAALIIGAPLSVQAATSTSQSGQPQVTHHRQMAANTTMHHNTRKKHTARHSSRGSMQSRQSSPQPAQPQ
jgi:hypothetical protein